MEMVQVSEEFLKFLLNIVFDVRDEARSKGNFALSDSIRDGFAKFDYPLGDEKIENPN